MQYRNVAAIDTVFVLVVWAQRAGGLTSKQDFAQMDCSQASERWCNTEHESAGRQIKIMRAGSRALVTALLRSAQTCV